MTLRIEITKVETTGDGLRIEGQGAAINAPDWQQLERCSFVVPLRYQRTYYVGRIIVLKVQP